MRRLLILISMATCALTMVACGGGSGGGGASPPPVTGPGPGPGTGGGGNPALPPALPVLNYSGSVSSPTLADQNVGAFADLIYDAVIGGILNAESAWEWALIHLANGEETVTVPGPQGGTMTLSQRINEGGSGWESVDYVNFQADGIRYHGRVVLEDIGQAGRRISFHELETRTERGEFVYHGTLLAQRHLQPGGNSAFEASGSLLVDNLTRGYQMFSENLLVQQNTFSTGFEISATGRVYHSHYGWLDFEFDTPWSYRPESDYPAFGGPVIGRNGSGHELRIEVLDREYVSLQYPSGSPAVADRAARQVWPWLFEWQTLRPGVGTPMADAGPNLVVGLNEEVKLSPQYSTHTYTRFLSHQWRVLYRPPGSSADIEDVHAVRSRFTPDVPGRYLIELTVSDGNAKDRSVVAIAAIEGVKDYQLVPPRVAQLVRGQTASVGDQVEIDRTRYRMTALAPEFGHAPPSIAVNPVAGDRVQVSQTPEALTFLAEHRGVYEVELGAQSVGDRWPLDVGWVAVDTHIPFHPPAWFETVGSAVDVVVGDMNGNGIDDFVLAVRSSNNQRLVEVIYNAPPGGYASRISFEADARSLAVGDFSSNGRLDIAIAGINGVQIHTQQTDGTFEHTATLTGLLRLPAPGQLQTGDINGDGRTDLIMPGGHGSIQVALQQSDGTLSAFQSFSTGLTGSLDIKVGDLNNDGVTDVVVYSRSGTGIPETVGVFYGQVDGPPQGPIMLPYDRINDRIPAVTIGDLTGNGRNELVFATSHTNPYYWQIHVYAQDDSGSLVESDVIDIGGWIWQLRIGDFDNDGYPDLLQRGTEVNGLGLRFGGPDGQLAPVAGFQVDVGGQMVSGDFNGNGLTDIAYPGGRGVAILFGVTP